MGWMDYGDFVWTYNEIIRNENNKKKGLAICCIDSF